MPLFLVNIEPGDDLSSIVSKINANFDQIIMFGGGPSGPIGPQGIQGIPGLVGAQGIQGLEGEAGTKWFVGGILPTPGSPTAEINDYYLNYVDGNIYQWDGSTWGSPVGTLANTGLFTAKNYKSLGSSISGAFLEPNGSVPRSVNLVDYTGDSILYPNVYEALNKKNGRLNIIVDNQVSPHITLAYMDGNSIADETTFDPDDETVDALFATKVSKIEVDSNSDLIVAPYQNIIFQPENGANSEFTLNSFEVISINCPAARVAINTLDIKLNPGGLSNNKMDIYPILGDPAYQNVINANQGIVNIYGSFNSQASTLRLINVAATGKAFFQAWDAASTSVAPKININLYKNGLDLFYATYGNSAAINLSWDRSTSAGNGLFMNHTNGLNKVLLTADGRLRLKETTNDYTTFEHTNNPGDSVQLRLRSYSTGNEIFRIHGINGALLAGLNNTITGLKQSVIGESIITLGDSASRLYVNKLALQNASETFSIDIRPDTITANREWNAVDRDGAIAIQTNLGNTKTNPSTYNDSTYSDTDYEDWNYDEIEFDTMVPTYNSTFECNNPHFELFDTIGQIKRSTADVTSFNISGGTNPQWWQAVKDWYENNTEPDWNWPTGQLKMIVKWKKIGKTVVCKYLVNMAMPAVKGNKGINFCSDYGFNRSSLNPSSYTIDGVYYSAPYERLTTANTSEGFPMWNSLKIRNANIWKWFNMPKPKFSFLGQGVKRYNNPSGSITWPTGAPGNTGYITTKDGTKIYGESNINIYSPDYSSPDNGSGEDVRPIDLFSGTNEYLMQSTDYVNEGLTSQTHTHGLPFALNYGGSFNYHQSFSQPKSDYNQAASASDINILLQQNNTGRWQYQWRNYLYCNPFSCGPITNAGTNGLQFELFGKVEGTGSMFFQINKNDFITESDNSGISSNYTDTLDLVFNLPVHYSMYKNAQINTISNASGYTAFSSGANITGLVPGPLLNGMQNPYFLAGPTANQYNNVDQRGNAIPLNISGEWTYEAED